MKCPRCGDGAGDWAPNVCSPCGRYMSIQDIADRIAENAYRQTGRSLDRPTLAAGLFATWTEDAQ